MNFTELIRMYITPERINVALRVIIALGIGIPVIILIRKLVTRMVKGRLSPQSEQLIVRAVYFLSVLILVVSVLNEFGFKLSALLGAAGVLGVAIGFASQTSVSNIISGIFLISEKPFVVGDFIEVNKIRGRIESIDLLSLKLRLPDNSYVRVPNETMIKTEVTNVTRFPDRRVDLNVLVAYKEDLRKVLEVLKEIAASEPLALQEPAPMIVLESFGEYGINILYGVWGRSEDFFNLRSKLILRVKESFAAHGIEIPFPHLSLYAGSESEPIKITTKEVQE
ncbi:MAG: mechanosensitive ion channel family protein [Candidatus Cloacimonadota bacterium]|jgi:small-conductance mechanosensitive channel|nr:mechanosensitive ion channel family protein [Candidatus Cloacimonadota bacterium]OQC09564.1 MAG: Small-conductance mechanosensitive channel [Candidatus Cloacimonetes bacterium ADurb.Bin088]